jgi:hypothetical protein
MFDLNQQIAQWRQSLGQSESLVRSDLDELESHLRDQIDQLSLSGLSSEEAFWVAQRRIGNTANLPGEFAKVNGSAVFHRRLQWMLTGVLAYLLIFNLSHLASVAGVIAAYGAGLHGYLTGWIGQIAQLLVLLAGLALVIATLKSPGILRLAGSPGSGLLLGFILIVGSVLLVTARFMIPILAVRFVGIEDYGQTVLIQNVSIWAYSVVIPILAVILLLLLQRPAGQPELRAD